MFFDDRFLKRDGPRSDCVGGATASIVRRDRVTGGRRSAIYDTVMVSYPGGKVGGLGTLRINSLTKVVDVLEFAMHVIRRV